MNHTDFETWARECVRITDKLTGANVPFILNAAQRRVLGRMEAMRRAGRPIRLIMLKARQWGGSTLVQVYMAWMQIVLHTGWNSVICAHVKDASSGIRGMYSRLLRLYPQELKPGEKREWELRPYEGSQTVCTLPARECLIAVATAHSPNAVRGYNFSMAHLSEVAFWGEGDRRVAAEIVRTVSGTVPMMPDTLVVMESTANGRDNFFHDEWERALRGESDKEAIFVPWHEIEIYRRAVTDEERPALLAALDDYERRLMERDGVPLEALAWYHDKRREYTSHEAMMAEFPSTPEEAFATSEHSPFASLPEPLTAPDGEIPSFGVIIPGAQGGSHYCTIFHHRRTHLTAVADFEGSGTISAFLRNLRGEAREMVVVDMRAPDSPAASAYCATRARDEGFLVMADEEENPVRTVTPEGVEEGVELMREALLEGGMRERVPEMSAMYCRFRPAQWWRHPRMVARLEALRVARTRPAKVSAVDFLRRSPL